MYHDHSIPSMPITFRSKWVCVIAINDIVQFLLVADRHIEKHVKSRSNYTKASLLTSGMGEQWRPHDLRRTAATVMTILGVIPEVAERCLNHIEENTVKRTYQRHNYKPEMQIAWDKLGRYLTQIQNSLDKT